MTITEWFDLQRKLQVEAFNHDPSTMDGEARWEYLRWNFLALVDELMETLRTVKWKPWSDKRGVDLEEAYKEYVDCLHFLANIGLALHLDPERISQEFVLKQAVNRERQAVGY